MKALLVNCTLKASPERSNTEALADVVADALREGGVEVAAGRAVDHSIPPGVESEMGEGDEWPAIRSQILDPEILLFATKGPGPSDSYLESEEGREWSHSTGRAAAANLLAVARALEGKPIPAPPSE